LFSVVCAAPSGDFSFSCKDSVFIAALSSSTCLSISSMVTSCVVFALGGVPSFLVFFTSGSPICVWLEVIACVPTSGVGTCAHFFGSSVSMLLVSVLINIDTCIVSISMSFFSFAVSQAEEHVGVVLEVIVA